MRGHPLPSLELFEFASPLSPIEACPILEDVPDGSQIGILFGGTAAGAVDSTSLGSRDNTLSSMLPISR